MDHDPATMIHERVYIHYDETANELECVTNAYNMCNKYNNNRS